MRHIVMLAAALALAGCSQTTTTETASAGKDSAAGKSRAAGQTARQAPVRQASAGACAEAAKKAADAQMGAAMVGSALSMVGGFGGYAGRGGMVAAQAASMGGSLMQQQASNKAEAEMRASC